MRNLDGSGRLTLIHVNHPDSSQSVGMTVSLWRSIQDDDVNQHSCRGGLATKTSAYPDVAFPPGESTWRRTLKREDYRNGNWQRVWGGS